MLEHAIERLSSGRVVFVLAASTSQAKWLQNRIEEFPKYQELRDVLGDFLQVAVPGSPIERYLDPRTGETRGVPPNFVILVDHHYLETRFRWVLQEYHRWDQKGES